MATAVDLLEQVAQDGEAHDYLHQDCPFFRHVGEGGRDAEDVESHCEPARGPGRPPRLVVKLTPRTPEASTVPQPTVPPGGPGLFHVKGLQLPPYVQHLYKHLVGRYGKHDAYRVAVGVVKKWAQGIHPGGGHKGGKGGRVHADVQAAAARNVAEWEKDKATAHEHGAEHDRGGRSGKALAASASCTGPALPAAALAGPAMAPGAQAQYGLYQSPAATISPSPPLPPPAELPTPAEVRALAGLVPPNAADASLSRTVSKFIETAAVKLERHTPQEALASIRSAQTAVYAAHQKDLTEAPPYAWTVPAWHAVPAAEQSSAHGAMKEQHDQAMAWRRLDQRMAAVADKLRRNYFGKVPGAGVYGGPSTPLRLAGPAAPPEAPRPSARLK
jgi:hypothetical protein